MTTTNAAPEKPKKFRLLYLAPAFALIALVCWALASPVGSSPDDDFHLASIWCGAGNRGNDCKAAAKPNERVVPAPLIQSASCYAFHPTQSAACQPTLSTGVPPKGLTTDRGNFTGLYPPLYYATMSLFVMPNIAVSVIVMRIVNVLLFIGLGSALFVLLPNARRRTLVWAWVISIVPLGVFLLASNNPSAWAIISAGTVWLAVVGYFEASSRRKIGLGVVALIAAVMGAGSRADSAVYTVLGVIVAVILTMTRSRKYWISALLPFAIVLISIGFYFSAHQSLAATNGLPGETNQLSWRYLLITDLLELPKLWAGVFGGTGGGTGLGWLDTQLPGIVLVGCLMCFAAVVFSGLAFGSLRKVASIGLVVFALVAIPVYVLIQSRAVVGSQVQSRYVLPLIVLLSGLALFQVDHRVFRFSRLQLYVVIGALAVTNAVALHVNMRRYITGTDVTGVNLNSHIEWWWSIPVSPMVVWVLGSLSFALFLFTVVREVSPVEGSRILGLRPFHSPFAVVSRSQSPERRVVSSPRA